MRRSILLLSVSLGLSVLLTSCSDLVDPPTVSTHPEGWNDANSDVFHGDMVLESAGKSAENCTTCHGEDYLGGTSGVSCFTCHPSYPHPEDFGKTDTPDNHTVFIAEVQFWDIVPCRTCHGDDYAGKSYEEKNCLTCHTQDDGPEACNTCHGDAHNNAPPFDLDKNTSTTAVGVGAHQTHITESTLSGSLVPSCMHCHTDYQQYETEGHISGPPVRADLIFSPLATHEGELEPVWDTVAATCGSIYCHGSFVFQKEDSDNQWAYTEDAIKGDNLTVSWTDVGTDAAACGTCHGLPPTGHVAASTCNGCHPRVADENFNIVDPTLHINGQIDIF